MTTVAGSNAGSAYVFTRDGSGLWRQQAKLTASDAAEDDEFGRSVAISGDTVVIGACGNEVAGSDSGSAYVFTSDGSGSWTQQAKLTASDAASSDNVGYSVAVSGDTAVIGAWGDAEGGSSSGSAYVFTRDGSGSWTQQAKLTASDAAAGDAFGRSVAVSGDTAVIGANWDDNPGLNSGSVYVFTRGGIGSWAQQAKLPAPDDAENVWFGNSVAVNGGTAVIGAGWDLGIGFSGSAHVFDLSSCQAGCEYGPVLVDQPSGQAVCASETVVFQASATGTGQISYQWQHDGESIPGADD